MKIEPTVTNVDWHNWFAWYPVYTFEYGFVWFRTVRRKPIPADFKDRYATKSLAHRFMAKLTGCWYRIPD